MNKNERKRVINTIYGKNKNKYLKVFMQIPQNAIYVDTDSTIVKETQHAGISKSIKAN